MMNILLQIRPTDTAQRQIQEKDSNIGSAKEDNSHSLSSIISTLVPVLLTAAVFFLLFLLLRARLKRNYQPRTYLGSLRPQ